ncbi:hypothetical protein CCMA1212_004470 [Trichoderma ghanense]|uniref:Uncharacterized protein n=1 Tax=Trichoderma ghanense TaxID=65468 RepID=A0ABY2H5T3_9HYPO
MLAGRSPRPRPPNHPLPRPRQPPPAQKAKLDEERPKSLRLAPGNVRWVDGDLNGNVAGIASIAFVAVSMLEKLSTGNAAAKDVQEVKEVLQHIGGAEAVNAFRKKVQEQVGSFGPEPTEFLHLFDDKPWEANPVDDEAEAEAGESAPGREASLELGSTPVPAETGTAGREREGSAPQEAAAGPVVIPDDPETSDEQLDSSDEPLALKRARAAEKQAVTSKYFGAGGAGGAGGKA